MQLSLYNDAQTKCPKTKRSRGQNVPWDKMSQGQNVPGTKHPKVTNEAQYLTWSGQLPNPI